LNANLILPKRTYPMIYIFADRESCMDILRNNPEMREKDGVYSLNISGQIKQAFCDMTTDTGGWTVST
jgi:hypothetical protein